MAEESIIIIIDLLGVALVFAFGWNNSSFLLGNGMGSGSLTLREAMLISSVGLMLGVVLEGSKMLKSLNGNITPSAGGQVIMVALLVSLLFSVGLTLLKLPVSFSMVLVGAFAGAAYGSSLPLEYTHIEEIIGFWVVAPLATAALAYVVYKGAVRLLAGASLITLDGLSRYGVIISALVIAYVLGANNIGLIYGTTLEGGSPSDIVAVGMTLVAIVGMIALGRGGVSGTIGDRMLVLSPLGVVSTFLASAVLVWFGTQFSIPISISQCLLGGMFGAALTKQITVVNTRLAMESFASWAIAPSAAFLVALLVLRF